MLSILRNSIKKKLIAIQVVTSAILLFLFAVTYISLEVQDYKSTLKDELSAAANVIVYNAIPALTFQDPFEAAKALEAMSGYDNLLNAWIVDTNAFVFASYSKYPDLQFDFAVGQTEVFKISSTEIIFSKDIVNEGIALGTLFFRIDKAEYHQKIGRVILVAVLVMLIGFFVSLFMANYSQRAISVPIIRLKTTFERLKTDKDFSIRVKKRSDDEIGQLYDGFNALADEIQFYGDHLEMLVKDRTHDLEQANQQLKETSTAFEEMNYALKDEINQRIKFEMEVQASEEKMRIILQTMEEGVAVYTSEQIMFVNAAFCRLLGYREEDFVGKSTAIISKQIIHPEDFLAVNEAADSTLNYKEIHRMEYRYLHKDGTIVWVSGVPAIIPWGNEEAIIATVVDITQHKKDKNELLAAKVVAEAANKAKSTFLANMSHEIRTPMNAVLGYSQILQHDTSLNKNQKQFVNSINRSGEHLLSLINDILDMSKIEAGRVQLILNAFKTSDLARDVMDFFKIKADEKKLKLEVSVADDIPQVILADQNRVRQIIINLVGNALKFSHKGTVSCSLILLAENKLKIEVKDQGSGIPLNLQEKIFEPFEQINRDGSNVGGTGLGLSISRKLARLMGGDITVSSIADEGSTFCFSFEFREAPASAIIKTETKQRVIKLAKESEKTKVLVIDDKPLNRDVVKNMLQPLGFEIAEAEDGAQGVKLFEEWSPDIVIMDIVMPVMDGKEATKVIRKLEKGKNAVIIAVTASALDEERAEILSLGVDDFVRKPFHESELLDSLKTFGQLKYIYDVEDETDNDFSTVQIEDYKKEIEKLDPALMRLLSNALIIGDMDVLQKIINKMKVEYLGLANYMESLLNDFKMDEINDLVNLKM